MGKVEGRIKTVVVLMMENRSFDHMLGWMKRIDPEIDGVTGEEWNPLSTTDPDSEKIYFKDTARYVDPDPGHSFDNVTHQVLGAQREEDPKHICIAEMNGFAEQAETVKPGMSEVVMNGFSPETLPVYKELVQEFAVFDRWFSSLPTLTQPNRLFVHAATSHGEVINDTSELLQGYPQRTIFQSIEDAGLDFGIYFQSFPNILFYQNMRKFRYIRKFKPYDLKFKKHARKGKLPNYVVIEPCYFDSQFKAANDDHPAHDVAEGQRLVKEVYEILRCSPQWNEMVFVITYDEHGGFFDHVPTPLKGVPNPDGLVSPPPHHFGFDRLGVRVPTIVISPWIEKGTVVHEPVGPFQTSQYEHASIPATVKKLFNLPHFLTKRDEWAGTFDDILMTRSTPRTDCPETLPTPERLRDTEADEKAPMSEFQKEMVMLAAHLTGRDNIPLMRDRGMEEEMSVEDGREVVEGAVGQYFSVMNKGMAAFDELTSSRRLRNFLT